MDTGRGTEQRDAEELEGSRERWGPSELRPGAPHSGDGVVVSEMGTLKVCREVMSQLESLTPELNPELSEPLDRAGGQSRRGPKRGTGAFWG